MTEFEMLEGGRSIDDRMVNEEFAAIWRRLRTEQSLRLTAAKAGLDLALLDGMAAPPFVASRDGAYVGIPELILISASGGIIAATAKGLWTEIFWPELTRRFPVLRRHDRRE